MEKEFIEKLNNNEYISTLLYEKIKETNSNIIPENFSLDIYNEIILEKNYEKYKNYFENMYKNIDDNIHLDKEQIKAILADEDYSLIIAGAGTGKTTTMASKVKYLVDIKKVPPEKIVVMSFTKKATQELEKRIITDFGINANVTTFHSLGLMYIREKFKDRKCYVVDENTRNKIFLEYFKENIFPYKEKVKEILETFKEAVPEKISLFGKHFQENYENYNTFNEYFEEYKNHKIRECKDIKQFVEDKVEKMLNQETIYTINNEIVKSKGEAIIANFLLSNGIDYEYEKIYEELMEDRHTYKPDFTLDLAGEKVYIEYFGLSTYKENELKEYERIKQKKEKYHQEKHNKFIKIDYKPNENLIETLKEELLKMGFILKQKTPKEIYTIMLNNNPFAQLYQFKNLIYKTIDIIKSSTKRNDCIKVINEYINNLPDDQKDKAITQAKYIIEFYKHYNKTLYDAEEYGFDFSDMVYYANKFIDKINTSNNLNFEYIIIDEYQDISQERYELTKNIVKQNNAKVIAVGDDWQSIYAFTGSNIGYIYNFQKYFKGAKLLKITNTYRNSQQLIDCSGNFIMKNQDQIKKDLKSNKNQYNPINIIWFEKDNEYKTLKELILKIHQRTPDHNILILARKNKIIKNCYKDPELIDEIGTKIKYEGHEDIDIDGMTIHKSKGLTSDEVIVIGLNQEFPAQEPNCFWLQYIFKSKTEKEAIEYAEERRIFYVALTRTKNHVYLLVNKDAHYRSKFVDEIEKIKEEINKQYLTKQQT